MPYAVVLATGGEVLAHLQKEKGGRGLLLSATAWSLCCLRES